MHSLIHEHLAHATASSALTTPVADSLHRDACEFGRPGCLHSQRAASIASRPAAFWPRNGPLAGHESAKPYS